MKMKKILSAWVGGEWWEKKSINENKKMTEAEKNLNKKHQGAARRFFNLWFIFCSTSLPLARVQEGFDQRDILSLCCPLL